MKVLFLDFDGVLNSQQWFIANEKTIKATSGLTWRHSSELDPAAVRRVLRIIEVTNAAVVISSSWRILHSLTEIEEIFEMSGFPEMGQHIIDKTPFDPTRHVPRGQEIHDWIKTFEAKNGRLDSYAILDDDSDMLPFQKAGHFVQTSWETGIQDAHVEKAIQILGATNVPV